MTAPDLHAALRASTPKVAAIGTYIVDVLGRPVSELPRGQHTRLLDEIRLTAAGTSGGTAVDLARLGAQVTAVASIGTDLAGDFLLMALERERIDTTNITRRDELQTSTTILPIHPDGSRPAWHVPGANMLFAAADVPAEALTGQDAVHLGGLTALPGIDGAPAGELLAAARAAGAITTADCLGVRGDDPKSILAPVLPHVDLFMPNDGEAMAITGAADPLVAARELLDLGPQTVIVKCGPDGAVVADADGLRAVPGIRVEHVVDTTGCGDAFCAGVIVARCAGWPIDDAARLGCATGALNVRALGSDAGARDVDEALAFLDANAREATA